MKKYTVGFLLVSIFCLVLFLTAYFNATEGETIYVDGEGLAKFYLSGPDPYYNMRLVKWTLEEGIYPGRGDSDTLLNFPVSHVGAARPPLMNMMAIGFSRILTPFMSETDAVGYSMQILPCIFGALLIFPIYFIGKSLFDKKTGLVSALLIALIPIHISSGHGAAYTLFDHDAFNLLLFTLVWCFFIMGIKSKNKMKNLYFGILTGVCLGALSMVWVSAHFTYTVLAVYFAVQVVINLLSKKVNYNLFIVTFSALLVGYLLFLPLGFVKLLELFLVIFVGGVSLLVILLHKFKIPWIISIPSLTITGIGGIGILYLLRNTTHPLLAWTTHFSGILFGGGIYADKIARTIAEAGTFDMSRTVMSFGPSLYWIAFAGFVFLAIRWYKNQHRQDYVFFLTLFIIEIWIIGTAGRFLNDFIPLVTVLSAFIITGILTKLDYKSMIRNIRHLEVRRFYKGIKISHYVGIILVFIILFPNTFMVIEASIPRAAQSEYFGEDFSGFFGTGHYKEIYWVDALSWLNEQDREIEKPENRPGFISWWDYGFYEVALGGHPTVADNFQEGFQCAGNFHVAQTEQEAQSIFIIRLIEGDMKKNNGLVSTEVRKNIYKYFPTNFTLVDEFWDTTLASFVTQTDQSDFQNETILEMFPAENLINVLQKPEMYASSYNQLVGEGYGNTELRVTAENARYHDGIRIITENLTEEEITQFLLDIERITGTSIRYYGVEGYDIQIFDVFTFLSDRGLFGIYSPEDDFKVMMYVDKNGDEWSAYEMSYMDMVRRNELGPFSTKTTEKDIYFNTMLYKTYIQATNGLKHFKPVYLSPYGYPGQNRVAVIIAKYYPGCNLTGKVTLDNIPMQNTMIGIYDDYDLLHDYGFSDENGEFSLISLAGNGTLRVFIGGDVIEEVPISTTEDEANRLVETEKNISISIGYGNLTGYVTNTTESTIRLYSESYESTERYTMIDETGYYEFVDLIPGSYKVHIGDYNTTIFVKSGNQEQNFVANME